MNLDEAVETFLNKGFQSLEGLVVGLTGTLGAGKTHLVKKLLKTVDPRFESQVQSPTYNICNVYVAGNLTVHHFDLYRLESEEAIYDIEIWESISSLKNLIFIEWVDNFPELMAECDKVVSIYLDEDGSRRFEIK